MATIAMQFTQMDLQCFVSILEDSSGEKFAAAWDHLIQQPNSWLEIRSLGPERCEGLLNIALNSWMPTLKTNQLALLVHKHSGVAMVHVDPKIYRDTYLYAFSLVWEVDSVITLNKVLAAAAFGLATPATNTKAVTTPMATPMAGNSNDVEDAEDDVIDLPYDQSSILLYTTATTPHVAPCRLFLLLLHAPPSPSSCPSLPLPCSSGGGPGGTRLTLSNERQHAPRRHTRTRPRTSRTTGST